MTTLAATHPDTIGRTRAALSDSWTATLRYLMRVPAQPDQIVGGLLMPVIFVVLFGYVFGSAIHVPGGHYRTYLMSGLFAQTTMFSSAAVAVAVATDMKEGVIDRYRSLPVSRSSVLVGRTLSTVIIGLPSLAVMIGCALLVGWRAHAGLGNAVAAFALLELFGFAMGWVGAVMGMYARGPQSADAISMLPAFILGFVSNVFVPTTGMPSWLRWFAEWNPLSAVVAAARQLFGTPNPPSGAWSQQHPIVTTLALIVLVLAVTMPVAVGRFARRAG